LWGHPSPLALMLDHAPEGGIHPWWREVRKSNPATPEPRNPADRCLLYKGRSTLIDPERWAAAVSALQGAVERSMRKQVAAMHSSFVRSADGLTTPPLAHAIQGGRGGEVRLKIFLCMYMMATHAPHDIKAPFTPRGWARHLALPADAVSARRISSNIKWLERESFIALEPRAGNVPRVLLLDPATGGQAVRPVGNFFQIPLDLWAQGWIVRLSATGLALLLVLLDLCNDTDGPRYVTRFRRLCYGLSPDTWTRGRKELEMHELIVVGRTPQGNDYDPERLRNTYLVRRDELGRMPRD
jgi:hypothetical protein